MADSPPPFDVRRAHRWFAVEFNNSAWALLEQPDRSPAQTATMLDHAHAAAAHWSEVGNVLNHLRAQCLLAVAHAAAGNAAAAMTHANDCLARLNEAGDRATPWDHATAHGCAAVAFARNGDPANASRENAIAREIVATLSAEDRIVFETFFTLPA